MAEGGFNPADPWSFDAFAPQSPKVPEGVSAPSSPKAPTAPKAPRIVPAVDELFSIQRNTLKVLNGLDDLEHEIGEHLRKSKGYRALRQDAENAYRVIRSYLKQYGS